jgi:MinD superfamily P-loop ATPase
VVELAVLSGKGGTGKTSLVASFAALSRDKVLADCDVDASDLHLVLGPRPVSTESFSGSKVAIIREDDCTLCGRCMDVCRFDAVVVVRDGGPSASSYRIDPSACEGCGACRMVCSADAVDLLDAATGEWYVSDTRLGPLVHAKLHPGQEASGKLVTVVRSQAAALAKRRGLELSIIDGSPGIGCPVIASMTGATLALVVTEPTMSGLHDLERVASVAHKLGVPVAVVVNKCDLNPEMSRRITEWACAAGARALGEIPYDEAVTEAQIKGLSVVEHSDGPAAAAIRSVWKKTERMLSTTYRANGGPR